MTSDRNFLAVRTLTRYVISPAFESPALRRLEGWLPLRGRWLRYALTGISTLLGGAGLLLLLLGSGQELLVSLAASGGMLLLISAAPRRASGATVAQLRAAAWCVLVGFATCGWLLHLGAESAAEITPGCGTYRGDLAAALYLHVPLALGLVALGARLAGSSRIGSIARIAAASAIGFWLVVQLFIQNPLGLR